MGTAVARAAIRARLAEVACRRKDGLLCPEDVVADAADPSSPLHGEFEWDDGVAAHAYRIERARVLIRSIRLVTARERMVDRGCVVVVQGGAAPSEYIHDPDLKPGRTGYVRTVSLQAEPARAARALGSELDAIEALVVRAEAIAGALGREGLFQPLLYACELLRKEL